MTDEHDPSLIGTLVEKHGSDLMLLQVGLRHNDTDAFEEGAVKLTAAVLKDVPVVGKPAGQVLEYAFARSAWAQMKRELANLGAEQDRERFIEALALRVEQLLGQALIQLVRVHHQTHDELVEALGGLREEFATFRDEFTAQANLEAASIQEPNVWVGRVALSGRATGVDVAAGATTTSRIDTVEARDDATVIKLK